LARYSGLRSKLFFIVSLLREAIYARRSLIEHRFLTTPQRSGHRLTLVGCIYLAVGLMIAIYLGMLAANNQLAETQNIDSMMYLQLEDLPRNLAVLIMLASFGLSLPMRNPDTTAPRSQKIFAFLAVVGTLIAILLAWYERMTIPALVYIAVSGIELAQPAKLLPAEMNISTALRIQHFALVSFAGLLLLALNLLLLSALTTYWNLRRMRLPLVLAVIVGAGLQVAIVYWFVAVGVRQLLPPMAQAFQLWPSTTVILVVLLITSASATFAWRLLAKPSFVEHSLAVTSAKGCIHKSWLAAFVLSLMAVAHLGFLLIVSIKAALNPSFNIPAWQLLLYGLMYPAEFIWFAATIGVAAIAWKRFQSKDASLPNVLPTIDTLQFTVVTLDLIILLLTGAVVLATVSFSCWFVQFRKVF
jgi:hypothetical protein